MTSVNVIQNHAARRLLIGRRQLATLLVGAGALPSGVRAQLQANRVARIAFLLPGSVSGWDPRSPQQFQRGLRENGLIDGQNIAMTYYWAEGNLERLKQLAGELAHSDFDVIVTSGPQACRELLAAGVHTPVVFAIVSDPIGAGFIASLAHPGGMLTGLSMSNSDLEGKRIAILHEAVPSMRRLLLLHDPSMGLEGLAEARAATSKLGLQAVIAEPQGPEAFEGAFATAVANGVAAVSVMASPYFNFNRAPLFELALRHRLPSIWENDKFVLDGGLLSYGPDFADMYRRSAGFVAKILRGAKPADLPVEQPTRFQLVINLKTAKNLGLEIPLMLVAQADEMIE